MSGKYTTRRLIENISRTEAFADMKKEYRNWVALFIQESYSVLNARKNRGLNDEQVELIVSSFPIKGYVLNCG